MSLRTTSWTQWEVSNERRSDNHTGDVRVSCQVAGISCRRRDGSHYDNDAVNYIWDFDVNFYSIDPGLVNTVLLDARRLMKSNGWIMSGKGHDLASDEPTHTGRGINVIYIER